MKLDKLNLEGKKDSIKVLDKIFSAKINKKLVNAVLYKTNANYKGRHAKTKQQNEVLALHQKFMLKKEQLMQDMQVKKHQYLWVVV